MEDKTATFRVELYYQGSAAWSSSKPTVSEVTLAEGAGLYMEDKHADHPNLPHYNFRIVSIAADAVILEQIPDRRGRILAFPTGAAGPAKQFRLEKGKPLSTSLNVPGGGPVWTVAWITPGAQPETKRAAADYTDYRNVHRFFEMFLGNPSFSVQDAVELLGQKQDESLPHRIALKPKSSDVQWAQLEIMGGSLDGISIRFAPGHCPSVSFSTLIRDYGKPHQLPLLPPRLRPGEIYHADYSYSFEGRRVLRGSLIVTVEGERKADLNPVVEVIYRRWRP